MLVLSRRQSESIVINGNITVTILVCDGGKVRIGIEAPKDVNIVRTELLKRQESQSNQGWPAKRAVNK